MPTIVNVASLNELPETTGFANRLPVARIGIGRRDRPQHSDDGVWLLLDDGSVLSGDLTLPAVTTEDAAVVVR